MQFLTGFQNMHELFWDRTTAIGKIDDTGWRPRQTMSGHIIVRAFANPRKHLGTQEIAYFVEQTSLYLLRYYTT
jgi:hypothetical protein